MIGSRFLRGLAVTFSLCAFPALIPACGGETAPLAITPHAIVISEARKDGSSPTHVLLFDVPVTCADARYLEGGAPEGARFKAILGVQKWKLGALDATHQAVLFDAKGIVSTTASGGTSESPSGAKSALAWGSFELLTAPRAKGDMARLRGSANGAFTIYQTRPFSEENASMVLSAAEPDRQEFSFAGDIDLTLCSDIVDAK